MALEALFFSVVAPLDEVDLIEDVHEVRVLEVDRLFEVLQGIDGIAEDLLQHLPFGEPPLFRVDLGLLRRRSSIMSFASSLSSMTKLGL